MQTEQEFHDQLKEYFCGLAADDAYPALDPEGKFAFVIMAFAKPSDPAAYAEHAKGAAATRGDRAAAVGVALAQSCPEVGLGDDDLVLAKDVVREGIHALCSTIAAKFLTEIALTQIVGQAQMVVAKRAEVLDD